MLRRLLSKLLKENMDCSPCYRQQSTPFLIKHTYGAETGGGRSSYLYDLPMLTECLEIRTFCYSILLNHVIYTYVTDSIKCNFSEEPNCRNSKNPLPRKTEQRLAGG